SAPLTSPQPIPTPFPYTTLFRSELPSLPGRRGVLQFSEQKMKFPKSQRLNENDKKAMALHSFANHELLAIEMMAAAILVYPHQRSEEHTSELQSRENLVCRLLLE